MLFRSIVLSALGVAVAAGLVLSLLQMAQVTPTLYAAEVYEIVDETLAHADQSHDGHHHGESWSPEDGIERVFYTFVSNVLTAFGFALLMISAMAFSDQKSNTQTISINTTKGVLWGLVGFICFFVVPGLGLPPEIPGMEAAVLEGRQSWWIIAVICTLGGFATLIYAKGSMKLTAIVLFALPWVLGAPQPEAHGFVHPDPSAVMALEKLQHGFIQATTIANAVFWIVLGVLSGYSVKRFVAKI